MRRAWLHKHNASNKLQGFFRSKAGGRSVGKRGLGQLACGTGFPGSMLFMAANLASALSIMI